jgi:choline dehydrogenase
VEVHFAGTDRLNRAMAEFGAAHWLPDEQTLAKARSRRCTEAFDLHLYAVITRPEQFGRWRYRIYVSSVLPRSVGTVTLTSADPDAAPVIDHGYLSDTEGEDRVVIADGVALARAIGRAPGVAELFGEETRPGPDHETPEEIDAFIARTVGIYYHPTSTCRMGPMGDPLAVVDPRGAVHGLEGLSICDASIFPTLMRANTNLPAAMIAEHMAGWIAASS